MVLRTDNEVVHVDRCRIETCNGAIQPKVDVRSHQQDESRWNLQRVQPPEHLHFVLFALPVDD
jgi:hypothetical protein